MDLTVFIPASAAKATRNIKRITNLLDSIREKLNLKEERKIIALDGYGDIREKMGRVGRAREIDEKTYQEFKIALKAYCQDHQDCEVVEFSDNIGLNGTTVACMSLINSKFVLNAQHDFEFIREIDLAPILAEMAKANSRVKHLRFNKRENIIKRWDQFLIVDQSIGFPALQTPAWMDNPHIMTTEHYRTIIEPRIKGVIGFPEEVIRPIYEKMGYEKGHDLFGTYIYGNLNDPPVVKH